MQDHFDISSEKCQGTPLQTAQWENAPKTPSLKGGHSFLTLMADASPLAFYVVDNHTDQILYFNHKFCEIWGLTSLEEQLTSGALTNQDIIPYCIPLLADPEGFAYSCRPLQDIDNRVTLEDTIPFNDGRLIRRYSTQLRGPQDEYCGRFYLFEDITQQQLAQEENSRQASLIISLLDTTPDMVFFKDTQGIYLNCNQPFADFVGKNRQDIIGRHNREIMSAEMANTFLEQDRSILAQKITLRSETSVPHPDGRQLILDTLKTPYCNASGSILGILGISRDITELKNIEHALRESEHNFRNFFDTMADMIFVGTIEGNIVYTNEAVLRNLGYSQDELHHLNIFDLHCDLSAAQTAPVQLLAEIFSKEHDSRFRPLRRKDGSQLPAETCVWFGKWDNSDCIFFVAKDLSIRQAALNKFHKLFDNNPALMAINNLTDRKFLNVNVAFLNTLGFTREEVIGKTLQELDLSLSSSQLPAFEQALYDMSAEHSIKNIEVTLCQNQKTVMTGLFSAEIIDSQLDQELFTVMTDITKLKQTEQEIKEINSRLEQTAIKANALAVQAEAANLLKSQFLANMSHEIRTPMNGIMGFLELLSLSPLSPEQQEYLREAKGASEVLLYVINDILDFSKIEAGKLTMENTPFKIRTAVEDTVSLQVPKATEKGLAIHTMIKGDVPEEVTGDPARLRQILNNLLSNAVKFTEQGEVSLTVDCQEEADDIACLKFTIADTGIGIASENIPKLFQSFNQADTSTTRRYGGTGLGLAISQELIRMMNGSITVNSVPDKGSVFTFTVRLKISQRSSPDTLLLEKLKGLNILVVDDNATNRKVLDLYLKGAGCTVTEAHDAGNAITAIITNSSGNKKIDVAIIDQQMPGMSGYELAATLKSIPFAKNIKLVLLTSVVQKGNAHLAKETGFAGYLNKPVRRDDMLHCIAMVMGLQTSEAATPIVTRYTIKEAQDALKPRILLVEDNEINRKIVFKMLQQQNLTCDFAVNGQEAINAVKRQHYDIVFMDCQMPVMDGYESTRRIRKMEGTTHHSTIIAMTANAMEGDRRKCLEAGMDDYLSKPIDFQIMFQMIQDTAARSSVSGKHFQLINNNIEAFLHLTGLSREDALELYQNFIAVLPQRIRAIEQALTKNDYKLLSQLAHQLKGSSGNLRITVLYDLAARLEESARQAAPEETYALLKNIKALY